MKPTETDRHEVRTRDEEAGFMILVLAYLERPVESSIAILIVVAGLPFYAAFAKSRAPTSTAQKENVS